MDLVVEVGEKQTTIGTLATDEKSVPQTIAAMQAMVDWTMFESADRARFIGAAASLFHAIGRAFAYRGPVLHTWLSQNVAFEKDPPGVELVRAPGDMLYRIQGGGVARGDCDDLACLAACMLIAGGLTPVFVTVSPENSDKLEHVFVGIRIGDDISNPRNIYPLDSQYRPVAKTRTPPGEWPFGISRVKTWGMKPSAPKV